MVASTNGETNFQAEKSSMFKRVAETFGDARGSILSSKIGGANETLETLSLNSARYKTHTNGFGLNSATVEMKANLR